MLHSGEMLLVPEGLLRCAACASADLTSPKVQLSWALLHLHACLYTILHSVARGNFLQLVFTRLQTFFSQVSLDNNQAQKLGMNWAHRGLV